MSNRPIPRRGLLGCWFLTDRGITYDAGQNQAIDRSGRGNHATYENGVTVGVAGDPSRDFGAAAFDAGSNQFADVGDPLGVDGDFAFVWLGKNDNWANGKFPRLFANTRLGVSNGFEVFADDGEVGTVTVDVFDGSGAEVRFIRQDLSVDDGEYFLITLAVSDGVLSLHVGQEPVATTPITGHAGATESLQLMARRGGDTLNGELAAAAKYDLTAPNAPEPSEIATRWDRLTDIPATR